MITSGKTVLINLLAVFALISCGESSPTSDDDSVLNHGFVPKPAGGFIPEPARGYIPEKGTLLIMGQDILSVRELRASGCCPEPGGITTYLGLYNLLSEETAFGGLGMDAQGNPVDADSDGGGGVMNARKAAEEFPYSTLAIGLDITENNHPDFLKHLVNGDYDAHIVQLGKLISRVNKPVYLRIGYEFDGAWNLGYENNQIYINAFRYIVDKLRELKVDNFATVWQASTSPVDDIIDGKHEDIRTWYPGNDYVDWLGSSWFLGIDEQPIAEGATKVASQRQLTDEVLALAREKNKPVMIAESAPQAFDLDKLTNSHHAAVLDGPPSTGTRVLTAQEIWQQWYQPFFDYIADNRDVIRAVAYISADWDAQPMWGPPYEKGYWGDSRIHVNDAILTNWLQATAGEDWLHGGRRLMQQLGYEP